MQYYNSSTQETASLQTIRRAFPNISIPDGADLSDIGWRKVEPSLRPAADPGHYVKQGKPTWQGNRFVQNWSQVPFSLPDLKVQRIRDMQAAHDADIAAGYHDTAEGFRIQIERENIDDWIAADRLADIAGLTSITVRDYDNTNHVMTASAYRALLARAGGYVQGLREKLWAKKDSITSADTASAVLAVEW